jgi:glycosyltransferase involved in cell wall biosynthesis
MEFTIVFFMIFWLLFVVIFEYRLINIVLSQKYFIRISAQEQNEQPFLSVIVPARNEEASILVCLNALLEQNYPREKYEIIVVNDNSTDKTQSMVENLAQEYPTLKLVNAPALPENWAGKNHACYIGYLEAKGEYLCFIDADTEAGKELLQNCVNFALYEKTDLLSFSPMQKIISAQEKLTLPAVFLCIAGAFNINDVNNPHHRRAIANGQFLMFKRSGYEAIGTHKVIQNEINDDITFAKIIKENGFRLFLSIGTKEQFSARMYHGIASVWKGFSKNLSDIVNINSMTGLIQQTIFVGTLSIGAYAMPLSLLFSDLSGVNTIFLTIGTLSFWSIIFFSALQLRLSIFYMVLIPISFWFYLILLYKSYQLKFIKNSREWKGRYY